MGIQCGFNRDCHIGHSCSKSSIDMSVKFLGGLGGFSTVYVPWPVTNPGSLKSAAPLFRISSIKDAWIKKNV